MTEFSAESPYFRRLSAAGRIMRDGVSIINAAGRVLITTMESAIDTVVDSTTAEIELYRIEHGDQGHSLAEIEDVVNNPEAHKNI